MKALSCAIAGVLLFAPTLVEAKRVVLSARLCFARPEALAYSTNTRLGPTPRFFLDASGPTGVGADRVQLNLVFGDEQTAKVLATIEKPNYWFVQIALPMLDRDLLIAQATQKTIMSTTIVFEIEGTTVTQLNGFTLRKQAEPC